MSDQLAAKTGRTRSRRSLFVGIAAATTALTVLSACSSSGQPSSGNTNSGITLKGSPLVIGVLDNVTGPLPSGEQDAPKILQAWAKSVNAAGGVAGHPVSFDIQDTKGTPAAGLAAAQKIVGNKKVVAVVMFDAEAEAGYADVISKAGLPVIGGMGFDPSSWAKRPNWLPVTTTLPSAINMGMALGASLGGTKAVLTICSESPQCAAVGSIASAAAKAHKLAYAETVLVSSSAPNYTAQCIKVKNEGVDYIMDGAATVQATMKFAADCKTQGYTGKIGVFGASIDPQVIEANDPGGLTLGVVLGSFPWFANNAPVVAYRNMMKAEGVSESVWANPHSTAAYATMELFKKTLDAVTTTLRTNPTSSDIITAYGTIKNETLGGLLPQPITFTPNAAEQPVTCYWFGQYSNKTFSDGDISKPHCDPKS